MKHFNANKNRKRLVFCIAFCFLCFVFYSQQNYFQQEVNYKINVRLNDEAHTLSAFEEIQYINNASQNLDTIYFHLWPNAYKNNSTALAAQLLRLKRKDFFFSSPEERGYIDSIDFKVNGKPIKWALDLKNPDICLVVLNAPLKPQDTITISTPFFVKVPDAKFSRLGHNQQAYFISQWYPKPAVFDKDGWHAMPYLDQGEFYSEFGSFDVTITLPENYLLAATGDRIDAEVEENFLNQRVIETINLIEKDSSKIKDSGFPASSPTFKTVRFKQYRVHDFAWFADKRFYVIHDQIQLPNTKKDVDTWVFFTPENFKQWKSAINYVNESTLFYSYMLGDYPYNNVTAVDGTIMAGGGMEYPNITVIGNVSRDLDLEVVITHEVGHNWFYGILGSNERDHPFLDEGINSFYEMRYLKTKYPNKKLTEYVGKDSTFKLLGFNKTEYYREKEFVFSMSQRAHTDQALSLKAPDFSSFNYGSIVYSKTPVVMAYLMDYMGEENLDKAMRFYYEQFKFKHPSPEDFIKTLTYFNGNELDWFSKHLLASTDHIDYKVKSIKQNQDGSYSLKLKNKTGVLAPLNIYGLKKNKVVGVIWYNGFAKTKTLDFPPGDIDLFKIDGLDLMPEINKKNNLIKTKGLFKKLKPLQLNLLTHLENPRKSQINFLPIGGVNFYNKLELGVALSNYNFYENKFQYLIAPMFAFKTKTPVGFVHLNYNIYPDNYFQKITLGVKAKSFAYDYFSSKINNEKFGTQFDDLYLNYYKIAPYIQMEIKRKNANDPNKQFLSYTANNLFIDSLDYPKMATAPSFNGAFKNNTYAFVGRLSYDLNNNRVIDPYNLRVELQHTASMAKISANYNYRFSISKKYFFDIGFFAGSFIAGNENEKSYYAFRPSGYSGSDDYLFDYSYFGRNETNGLSAQQLIEKDGNLKVPVIGARSYGWMASMNLKSPKIFILPLRFFVDVMACDKKFLQKEKVLWDAGLNVSVFTGIVEVYIPLAYSTDIQKTLELNQVNFADRIRFTLNIHKLVPKDLIRNYILER